MLTLAGAADQPLRAERPGKSILDGRPRAGRVRSGEYLCRRRPNEDSGQFLEFTYPSCSKNGIPEFRNLKASLLMHNDGVEKLCRCE